MSFCYRAPAGPQAKVLVDTGHHYAAQNIEQIVAWLLSKTCSRIFTSTIAAKPRRSDYRLIDPY